MRSWLGLLVLIGSASGVHAHPAPFSYLDLRLGGAGLEGTLVVHVIDVAHELGLDPPERLLDPAEAARAHRALAALINGRLTLGGEDGAIVPEWGTPVPVRERQALRLAFALPGVDAASLSVQARLFPYDPFHQTFLNLYEDGRLGRQAVFNGEADPVVYYAGSVQGRAAVVATFVPAGIHHILIGPDHILFLVGLLLLGGGVWPLVRIVTAFTLGHSVTLSLAALGVVSPPAGLVEPVIALSIVFVGVDNLLVGSGGRDIRGWAALGFGLVHGFGFASVLREFGIPDEALGWSLLAFNLGVEVGQLLVVAVVVAAMAALTRLHQGAGRGLAVAGSLAVVAAGGYWFVERVFF